MFSCYLNLTYEIVKITTEIKLTYQAEVSGQLRRIFEYKQETVVTQEMRKVSKLKTETTRRKSWRLCLEINIWRLFADMTKFGGYSTGIAQIHDEIKEKLNFRVCPNSTISQLVSRSDMSDMRCFPIGGMKNQHDAVLYLFGTTEEIIYTLTHLPSTTYSLLPSSLFDFKNLELAFSL